MPSLGPNIGCVSSFSANPVSFWIFNSDPDKRSSFFTETTLCANCQAAKGKKVCVDTIIELQYSQAKKRGHTNANYVRFHVWFGVDGTQP